MAKHSEPAEITTAEAFAVIDDEMLEALVISEDIPAFADEVLDQLADDWCRSQHTVDELHERQRLAGVAVAEVVTLPIPASQVRPSVPLRSAA